MSEKRALTKFLRCVEWSDVQVSLLLCCKLVIDIMMYGFGCYKHGSLRGIIMIIYQNLKNIGSSILLLLINGKKYIILSFSEIDYALANVL
jgi:hypothetical protein